MLWASGDDADPLDAAAISAAGRARAPVAAPPTPDELVARCVRYTLGVDVALRRERRWLAIELLHRIRILLMEVFARTHGGGRTPHVFAAHASEALQARLSATLPGYTAASIRAALDNALDVLERDLEALSAGRAQLNDAQRDVLRQVRARPAR